MSAAQYGSKMRPSSAGATLKIPVARRGDDSTHAVTAGGRVHVYTRDGAACYTDPRYTAVWLACARPRAAAAGRRANKGT